MPSGSAISGVADLVIECAVAGEVARDREASELAADGDAYRLAMLAAIDVMHRQAVRIGQLDRMVASLRQQLRAILETDRHDQAVAR